MKNPFTKDNNYSLMIVAVAFGAIAAGAITYLCATKKGFAFSKKRAIDTEKGREKPTAYLEKKARKLKKKTTGLHQIEEIVKG